MSVVILSALLACNPTSDPPGSGPDKPPIEEEEEQESPPEKLDPEAVDVDSTVPPKTLHRLNRAEYDNTVADLLATTFVPSALLPPDDVTHNFDNMAEALTTSSSHLTGYEAAADRMLDELWGRFQEETLEYWVPFDDPGVIYEGEGKLRNDGYQIEQGSVIGTTTVQYDGLFEIRGHLVALEANGVMPVAELEVNGTVVATTDFAPGTTDVVVSHQLQLDAGLHRVTWRLANPAGPYDDPIHKLTVQGYEMEGPLDPINGPTAAYEGLIFCDPEVVGDRDCAEDILDNFLRAAWRRPPTADDLTWAMGVYDLGLSSGEVWDGAVQTAMKAVLLHPNFMYRVEDDPEEGVDARRLDGYERASRLSYFLWSSMPDQALYDAVESGALERTGGVTAQVQRMLEDERASALVDNLAGQWWGIRRLDGHTPVPEIYPDFDDALRTSMQLEMEFLAEDFFAGRIDLDALMLRQETWIDARLADHYGLPWAEGDDGWVLTPTPEGRSGLLGTAGWLTATSNLDAPSNVRRGKLVLQDMLCSVPPPPPPDVEGFEAEPEGGSVRQQEEALRADASCQGCHVLMDPIGYVLTGYDAVGAERTVDELGYPIDTVVELEGTTMSTMAELTNWVTEDSYYAICIVEKTFTYAMGRPPVEGDEDEIERITDRFLDGGATFGALAEAITTSRPFLMRSAPEEEVP